MSQIPADPFFLVCLEACTQNREFVREFDRLTGNNLSRRGTGIELMVDDQSGRTEAGVKEFVEAVRVTVYEPLKANELLQSPSDS